jgi:hypothetical protein
MIMSVRFDTLIVKELSLIKKGANKEKQWLLYKSEEPPKPLPIENVMLASDLETMASMMKGMQEVVARMMANAGGKKDYKYPYPDKKGSEEEEEMARRKTKSPLFEPK